MSEIDKRIENFRIALENAQEQCQLALDELNRLKVQNETNEYMKVFDAFIADLTGGVK